MTSLSSRSTAFTISFAITFGLAPPAVDESVTERILIILIFWFVCNWCKKDQDREKINKLVIP